MQPLLRLAISVLVATTISLAGNLKNRHPAQTSPVPIPKEAPSLFLTSNHFYVGIAAGRGSLANSATKEKIIDRHATAVLGYRLRRFLSIEARYTRSIHNLSYRSGNLSTPNSTLNATLTNKALYLKPSYSFGKLRLYGLVGYTQSKITNLSYADRTEAGFGYGVGVGYQADSHWELFADYARVYHGKGFDGRSRLDRLSLDIATFGINYHF